MELDVLAEGAVLSLLEVLCEVLSEVDVDPEEAPDEAAEELPELLVPIAVLRRGAALTQAAVPRRKAVLTQSLRKQMPARKLPTSRQTPRTPRPEAVTPSCRAA